MAYSASGLTRLAGGSGVNLYHYSTTDAIADVNTEGYFNDLSDTLAVGDTILVRSSTGGTQALSWVYVLTNASGVVDVSDGLTITATDTD